MDMPLIIERILISKKLIYASIPVLANMIAEFFGVNPMNKALLVVDGFFALLLIIQGFLDVRYGSESDDTKPAPPEATPQTVVNVIDEKEK